MTPERKAELLICGHCDMPIHPGDTQRHFGTYSAHLEYRCHQLLKERIAALEAENRAMAAQLATMRETATAYLNAIENKRYPGSDFSKVEKEENDLLNAVSITPTEAEAQVRKVVEALQTISAHAKALVAAICSGV